LSQSPEAVIRLIAPSDRRSLEGPPELPFRREEYVGREGLWIGEVTTEPGGASPWHHHGNHTTYGYVLEGEASVEYGEGGTERQTAYSDGSLIVVPPGLVHREVNTGSAPNRLLIFRVGEGPAVVPADDPRGG